MIHGFAQQSGGQVRVYSKVGQGTTTCLYLPRNYGSKDESEAPAEAAEAPRTGSGETVLVVDEPTVTEEPVGLIAVYEGAFWSAW